MAVFAALYTYAEAQAAGRDEHRPAHRAWLNGLVEQGVVLTSGPYPDGSGALILFKADDQAAAESLFANDPFAQHKLLHEARIVEWKPTMGAFAE
ncbi:YciI family protein [Nocardia miyunensis]|uniref:YciI family protein n=1 Tax=Nocardia miyunensis TaxID=282684 RepID=UPI000829C40C|nr:YciI family protein [Nocardia miyunensis]